MPPYIQRLQVEEGFLSGLDIRFVPGLNVVIGPRGVGKTSVIELIRFCLGAEGGSRESNERARTHALSILGSGKISITLNDGKRETLISRSASDDEPRSGGPFRPPLVFSQNQIESVGLEARGRLQIIDGFAGGTSDTSLEEKALEAVVRSFTIDIKQQSEDLEATKEQILLLAAVPDELTGAIQNQESVLRTVKQSEKQAARLKILGDQLASGTIRTKQIDQAITDLDRWRIDARAVLRRPPRIAAWPSAAGPDDLLAPLRAVVRRISLIFDDGLNEIDKAILQLQNSRAEEQSRALALEDESRKLRKELEQLRTGAGTAAQRVAALKEKSAQLAALSSRVSELNARLDQARERRGQALAELQQRRNLKFAERSKIAQMLTNELGPRVQVTVEQGGDAPGYVGVIQAAVRGSGLHHSTLAPHLANAMSPRELAEAVERGDRTTIANLSGVGEDRASKIIAAIARTGTEEIITAPIHDRVSMRLLDGQEYRPTTELSTGQRCTVVLSVLLGFQGRGLVIDQPEDNLDNAFIVDTLIGAIRRQKAKTQLLFTTHNANIPVLGEAEQVVLLGSDGQRGFEKHSGPLSDPEIVRAIMSVMEGGQEAFERRAAFYQSRLPAGSK